MEAGDVTPSFAKAECAAEGLRLTSPLRKPHFLPFVMSPASPGCDLWAPHTCLLPLYPSTLSRPVHDPIPTVTVLGRLPMVGTSWYVLCPTPSCQISRRCPSSMSLALALEQDVCSLIKRTHRVHEKPSHLLSLEARALRGRRRDKRRERERQVYPQR